MPQTVLQRRQLTVDYQAGAKQSIKLERGLLYRELLLQLAGQLTCTAVNNSAANTKQGDEWAVVPTIELLANGSVTLWQMTGDELWYYNAFTYGVDPSITTAIGDGATLNPSFNSVLSIPLWSPDTWKPIDTLLDAPKLSDLRLDITWGTHLSVNASATGFTVNPSIKIGTRECFNIDGSFIQKRMVRQTRILGAAQANYRFDLAVGPMYRGFLINVKDGSGNDSATILQNLKVLSGPTTFYDQTYEMIRQMQFANKGMPRALTRRSSVSKPQAWSFVDLLLDGKHSESIDTYGFGEFALEFDVNAACQITVIPLQLFPAGR